MRQIVECVPNFSEGRDLSVLGAIVMAISEVPGVKCLNAEPNKDYHRSVVTFVGPPDAVVEGAFEGTKKATALIDMRMHKGGHPRMGAVDVVPFVPVSGVTMNDCVALAETFGDRVGRELQLPVFLYEAAAKHPDRRNLSVVRKGEYEGLEEKLKDSRWCPDYGPAVFNAQSGAVITGARMFLIAYNVNLAAADLHAANEIAARIRESGRTKKGEKQAIPGSLKSVKAMGVLLEGKNIAQVSMNLVDFSVTPPHIAFEEVKREAASLGIEVTGSEIVGLVPKEALLKAGRFYAPAETQEDSLIRVAMDHLGLGDLEPFDAGKKVIEYQL